MPKNWRKDGSHRQLVDAIIDLVDAFKDDDERFHGFIPHRFWVFQWHEISSGFGLSHPLVASLAYHYGVW